MKKKAIIVTGVISLSAMALISTPFVKAAWKWEREASVNQLPIENEKLSTAYTVNKEDEESTAVQTVSKKQEKNKNSQKTKPKKKNKKEEIFYKMLNSVDYYDTAQGSFTTVLGEDRVETEVDFSSDLNETEGYEKVKNQQINKELYVEEEEKTEFDNKRKTYQEEENVLTREGEEEILEDEDRIEVEEDGSKSYNYRDKITNLSNADMVLAPQEITFSFLGDFSKWKIAGYEKYLNRNCVKIEGTTDSYYQEKLDVAKFTFWVDEETGFLLNYEGYNKENKLTDYIRTDAIKIDKPVTEKKISKEKKKYKKVVQKMHSR